MTPQNMQEIINKSGLYHTEAAKLFDNITRQTLSNWLRGVAPKNKSIYNRAQNVCLLIEKGTVVGLLPLTPGTPAKNRMGMITGIIRGMMK